jgi:hypothetical protein
VELSPYDQVVMALARQHELGDGFELREVMRWAVHCKHCGTKVVGDVPQTEKAFDALKRTLDGARCRNRKCVSNGGTERRRR